LKTISRQSGWFVLLSNALKMIAMYVFSAEEITVLVLIQNLFMKNSKFEIFDLNFEMN